MSSDVGAQEERKEEGLTEENCWAHPSLSPKAHVPSPDLIQLSDAEPQQKVSSSQHQLLTEVNSDGETSDVEETSEPEQLSEGGAGMVSSTASDSPTPTNSTHERTWVAAQWHHQIYEEQRQLLGTEEESSDRHSSDEECPTDVYWITPEQKEYYINQFRSMQSDLQGLIPGTTAKEFFEKSRLPVPVLSKIWQLADVTRDGALSLDEFCTAMHLVVLQRNHVQLPDVLPSSLQPPLPPSKEWTRFVDSPSGSVSSPGPKPVNFDFQKPSQEQDPKLAHPVAMRVTPECGMKEEEMPPSARKGSDPSDSPRRVIQRPTPKKPTAPGPGAIPPPPQSVASPPDDTVDSGFPSGYSGPCSLPLGGAIVPPKKEPPPPPPPRPARSSSFPHPHHTRSSSLDLNKLGRMVLGAPPAIPPRVSPSTVSPKRLVCQRSDGDMPSGLSGSREFIHHSIGAFQVYRKPQEDNVEPSEEQTIEEQSKEATETLSSQGDCGAVSEALVAVKERSRVLNHLHTTLNHELSQLLEEKLQLQSQLHGLVHRPPDQS